MCKVNVFIIVCVVPDDDDVSSEAETTITTNQ